MYIHFYDNVALETAKGDLNIFVSLLTEKGCSNRSFHVRNYMYPVFLQTFQGSSTAGTPRQHSGNILQDRPHLRAKKKSTILLHNAFHLFSTFPDLVLYA